MAKIKKAASDRKVLKHKKGKPSGKKLNSVIKTSKGIEKKKHNFKHLPKQKKYDRSKNIVTSSVKREHKSIQNSSSSDKHGRSIQAFQANSISPTPNNANLSTVKNVKHKNRKFLLPLRERMLNQLKAARFRFINEQLYTSDVNDAQEIFKEDPGSFEAYHSGYKQQVRQWPVNPLDIIIKSLQARAKSGKLIVADFGCGEAQLALSLPAARVHSFDLVAANDFVTVCNMAHTPLQADSVDVVVFCLSLMGTNLSGFIKEANRVLRQGGLMKIAEVESRFDDINRFVKTVERFGFEPVAQDLSHNLFYFLDFKKTNSISPKRKNKLPELTLKPCLYKKR